MGEEESVGEVSRRIDRFENTITQNFRDLNSTINRLIESLPQTYVTRNEHKLQIQDLKDDVAEIKANQEKESTWKKTAGLTIALAAGGWAVTLILFLMDKVG